MNKELNRNQLIKEALETVLKSSKRHFNDLERSQNDQLADKMESQKVKIEQLETLLKEYS